MLLLRTDILHLSTLSHEGKALIVATVRQSGSENGKLYYTVKQDGFEDSALRDTAGTGWEGFKEVPFPNEGDDASVVDREKQELTTQQGEYLLRSIYRSAELTAAAPVQLVSHDGHVFLFRASKSGTLLADRFVLDGMTNELCRKLEVRFKRSGQRYRPSQAMRITSGGRLESVDSVDFRNMQDQPFHEPTTVILPTMITGLAGGTFNVAVTPTNERDRYRWHIFVTCPGGHTVTMFCIGAGAEQPFDVRDSWFRTLDPDTEEDLYTKVPGVLRRQITLTTGTDPGDRLDVSQGSAAVPYDVQREQQIGGGTPQLVRDTSRILLAVPTSRGIATLAFTVAANGTLAQIGADITETNLRGQEREVLLPLDTLDRIHAVGDHAPAASGTITGIARTEDDDGENTRVAVAEALTGKNALSRDDLVKIRGTRGHDGLYTVEEAQDGAFTVHVGSGDTSQWEKVEQSDTGLVFDGMLKACTWNDNAGTLTVSAVNHGLQKGDKVQLVGSPEFDGDYPVLSVGAQDFTIRRPWSRGEAINIRLESRKRRGLVFDGKNDWIDVPLVKPAKFAKGFTLETWVKPGSDRNDQALISLASSAGWQAVLQLTDRQPALCVKSGDTTMHLSAPTAVTRDEWLHLAATYDGNQGAMVFNGASFVELPPMTLDGSAGFTFEAWIWFDRIEESARIFDFGKTEEALNLFLTTMLVPIPSSPQASSFVGLKGGGGSINAAPRTQHRFVLGVYPAIGTGRRDFLCDANIEVDRWMHVAATITSGGHATLYLNGVSIGSETGMICPPAGLRTSNCLGRRDLKSPCPFRGRMRDVRLWRVARTVDEVKADMTQAVTGEEAGLVGAWMLDSVTGGRALDATRRLSGLVKDPAGVAPTGVLQLLVNGRPVGVTVVDAPPRLDIRAVSLAARLQTVSAATRVPDGASFFEGELSEARLWSIVRSAREVENAMNLEVTGREVGLYGCWRLGGLTKEGDGSQVFDFSVEAQHGWAMGSPCAGSMTLGRTLADGTRAVLYTNDELFAVREGGEYEERFQYRVSPPPPAAKDVTFTPSIWGRSSRSAQTRTLVAPTSPSFKEIGDRWHEASWRFVVPSGVKLLRCFEITGVGGDWEKLEIRRHGVKFLSDTVTLARAEETARLNTLQLAPADAASTLSSLQELERDEATLASRLQWLDKQLADLNSSDLPGLYASQQAKTSQLLTLKTACAQALDTARRTPPAKDLQADNFSNETLLWQEGKQLQNHFELHYFDMGTVTCPADKVVRGIEFYDKGGRLAVRLLCAYRDGSGEAWVQNSAINRVWDEGYGAFQGDHTWCEMTVVACKPTETLRSVQLCWFQGRMALRVSGQTETGTLSECNADGVAPLSRPDFVDKETVLCGPNEVPTGVGLYLKGNRLALKLHCYETAAINKCQADLALAKSKHEAALGEQARLKALIDDRDTLRSTYGTERGTVYAKLAQVQTAISTLETAFLTASAAAQNATLAMSRLPGQVDPAGLAVEGALLLLPAQVNRRLHALESCTGRVTLSYLDEQSRLGQIHYDTVYDADGRGEQWLASPFAVALKRPGTSIALDPRIFATCRGQVTIEFWARCKPVPSEDAVFLKATGPGGATVLQVRLPAAGGDVVWEAGSNTPLDGIRKRGVALAGPGRWRHWAFVKDASKGEMRILVDGTPWHRNAINLNDAKSKLSSVLGSIDTVELGASWPGAISELRIWSVALSDTELEANRLLSLTGNEPGLVACYPLGEARGGTARDQTGSGYDLTSIGDQWVPRATSPTQARAMRFNGTDAHVVLPPWKADLEKGFTIEAWVRYRSFKSDSRIIDCGVGNSSENIILSNHATTSTLRFVVFRGLSANEVKAPNALVTDQWMHLAATVDKDGKAHLYKNGECIASGDVPRPATTERGQSFLGKSNWPADSYFDGDMRDVRLWDRARTGDELRSTLNARLLGDEDGLIACWPLEAIYKDSDNVLRTDDLVSICQEVAKKEDAKVLGAASCFPITTEVVCAEVSRVHVDAEKRKTAMMQRCLAFPTWNGVRLLDDQRIEALELRWIGNAQIRPTLLGYIEGAPPVPSENLTADEDYNGATSVELIRSSDAEYSWTREQDVSLGAEASLFVGGKEDLKASVAPMGIGVIKNELEVKAGVDVETNFAYHWQNASSVSASHSLMSMDRLELTGSQENEARFPQLGKRFIPKNVGYALVTSGMADLFVSRLKRSGCMVGYQVLPVEGVPLDVNTITFLINPAYTMAGSLDGMTGSQATSDRFFRHVPEMRNQYGSLYPASYFRLNEAYALKAQIEKQDMDHQAYFNQFNAGLVDEESLDRQVNDSSRDGSAPGVVGEAQIDEEDPETKDLNGRIDEKNNEIKALESKTTRTDHEEAELKDRKTELGKLKDKKKARQTKLQDQRMSAGGKRQAEIAECHTDLSKRAHASESFAGWQKKMENLQIRAGKRNIVNTYVWDGDGGLHAEEQQFASTVEHTVGGSFDLGFGFGAEAGIALFGLCFEAKAMARVNLTQTMSKTERSSRALELHVDLSEMENRGITDHNDYPRMPGEKVDRYRFMSFYLEPNVSHWHDFFNEVVDPEWLASNDEEARALRETRNAAPNEVWRVLHRVTYVERPTLMGFGRLPAVRSESAKIQAVRDDVRQLRSDVAAMQRTLNQVLEKVTK